MGTTSLKSYNNPNFFQENYSLISQKYDQLYGEIKLFKKDYSTDQQQIAIQTLNITSKSHFTNKIKQLDNIKRNNYPNLINLIDYNVIENEDSCSCGSLIKIQIAYEYESKTLGFDIDNRIINKNYYEENEIWYTITAINSALDNIIKEYSKNYEGIIHPDWIILDKNGIVKLINPEIINPKYNIFSNIYLKSENNLNQKYFLSPNLLNLLKNNSQITNLKKNDVFSIGMTILQMCVLEDLSKYYDYDNYELDKEKINNLFENIEKKYSQNLVFVLKKTLEYEETNRFDFKNFNRWIANVIDYNEIKLAEKITTNEKNVVKNENLLFLSNFKSFSKEANENEDFIIKEEPKKSYLNNSNINFSHELKNSNIIKNDLISELNNLDRNLKSFLTDYSEKMINRQENNVLKEQDANFFELDGSFSRIEKSNVKSIDFSKLNHVSPQIKEILKKNGFKDISKENTPVKHREEGWKMDPIMNFNYEISPIQRFETKTSVYLDKKEYEEQYKGFFSDYRNRTGRETPLSEIRNN